MNPKGVHMNPAQLHIEDVDTERVNDLVTLCIPHSKKDDPLIIQGLKAKKEWAHRILAEYRFAKIAYMASTPVGMIQYIPHPEERIVEIQCIFVPDTKNHRKGTGSALLKALQKEMDTSQPWFTREPLALVAHAFDMPGWYSQHEFYRRMKFKHVPNNPSLLYYPIQKGYTYTKKEGGSPLEEDEGTALIMYDPLCPFCVYFTEKIKKAIKEVADIPIRVLNKRLDVEEVKKRGDIPICTVNNIPVKSFITDKERFQSEVKRALSHSWQPPGCT
jgi:hypothetical protein